MRPKLYAAAYNSYQRDETFTKQHPYRLIVFCLNGALVPVFRLLLSPEYLVERVGLKAICALRPAPQAHHQSDVKRKGVVKTRKMLLKVKVRQVRDYPPAISVSGYIPNFVGIGHDVFSLDPFNMQNSFIWSLAMDIASDVLFGSRIALDVIATDFSRRHWVVVNNTLIVVPQILGLRTHAASLAALMRQTWDIGGAQWTTRRAARLAANTVLIRPPSA
jgi:hypothetical protein